MMGLKQGLRKDLFKTTFVIGTVISGAVIFFLNPALSTPTLISVILTMVLGPVVSSIERQGVPRTRAIGLIMLTGTVLIGTSLYFATAALVSEWDSFSERAPAYFWALVEKMRVLESEWRERIPAISSINATDHIIGWAQRTGSWFINNSASLIGDLFTWMLIVPILSFAMLKDGRKLRKSFISLVPNRFFESTFIVSTQILKSISDYIRAKIVEATLVGLITWIGFAIVGAPYAFVLAVIAGITNILPYIGPLIGALPGILVVVFDPTLKPLLLPVALVYVVANVIDTALIFPLLVAKLVNLHPLALIVAVIIGQQYYGLVGMIVSIPVVAALKVILIEFHALVYENHPTRDHIEDLK